ncbi:MAG TPA: thiamine pyrophosphate-dependent enzyme [bacterium]|nr:thiamine pyrophosphate-dependent enzyme [bacterium]
MTRYGSDLVVDLLRGFGMEYAAINPGATFRGLHDSLVNYGGNERPEIILCCHEEISVAIAHGYAKAAGKPMVVGLHDLVGLQHASMAIFNAWCDRVPVLLLGGAGPMAVEQRRPWIDWIHTGLVQGQLVRDYVKWDDQPSSMPSMTEALLRAHRIAVTEPQGPVYIALDAALQESLVPADTPLPEIARYALPERLQGNPSALDAAVGLLAHAERPVILAERLGRHPGAFDALRELAELLACPVVDLYSHGRPNLANTHPLDLTAAKNDLLREADVILSLDVIDLYGALAETNPATREPSMIVGEGTKVIHITLDDLAVRSWVADYQRLVPVEIHIIADTALAVPALVERLRSRAGSGDERAARFHRLKAAHDASREEGWRQARSRWDDMPISPARLAAEVWESIKTESWVLANGALGGWPRRLWEWTRHDAYLGFSGGAGLGYGLGASIGAALAHRRTGRIVVDLQSDGDFLYTPSALWTAAHHQIPLLVVMCNNRSYGNDEVHQELVARARNRPVENRVVGIRLERPPVDFAGLARSLGVHGEGPIEVPGEIGPALRRALRVIKDQGRPALVDVVIR